MSGSQPVSAQAIKPEQASPNAGIGTTSNPPRFNTVSALQLKSMEFLEREWIIEGVIPKGLMSAIVAQSGTGKTWLMLDMARTLAAGGLWANQIQVTQRVVGLMDLEGNYTGLQERWLELEAGHEELCREAAERIYFMSDIGGINILIEEVAEKLKATILHNKIEVLFVDTLSRTHELDENSADMRRVMFALERVARDTGCTIIVAHHTGKNDERGGRGSSTIKDALQHEITLTRSNPNGGCNLALTKAKSAPLNPHLASVLIQEIDEGVRLNFGAGQKRSPGRPTKDQQIESYLREHLTEPQKRIEVIDSLVKNRVCSRGKASKFINELIAEHRLLDDGTGRFVWAGSSETFSEQEEMVYEQ